MLVRCIGLAAALALMIGCGPAATGPPPWEPDLVELLPDASSFEGWSVAEGPLRFLPATLYEYLDGGAPRYVTYGFRRLVHVRYRLGEDPLASVSVDLYDMGGTLGAFGIYRSGRPPGIAPRDWCAEGHRSGAVAAAWRSDIYVRAEADDERPELIGLLEKLLAHVCDRITGDESLPEILAPLPSEGLVPRSERYVAADLLGHAFLPGGLMATYDMGGREARLFFSDLRSETGSADALAKLRAHESRRGEILGEAPSPGAGGFRFSDPVLGSGTVISTGPFVAGIHGDAPRDAQERLLERLVDGLGSPAPRG
jgi:hypothetical protein